MLRGVLCILGLSPTIRGTLQFAECRVVHVPSIVHLRPSADYLVMLLPTAGLFAGCASGRRLRQLGASMLGSHIHFRLPCMCRDHYGQAKLSDVAAGYGLPD